MHTGYQAVGYRFCSIISVPWWFALPPHHDYFGWNLLYHVISIFECTFLYMSNHAIVRQFCRSNMAELRIYSCDKTRCWRSGPKEERVPLSRTFHLVGVFDVGVPGILHRPAQDASGVDRTISLPIAQWSITVHVCELWLKLQFSVWWVFAYKEAKEMRSLVSSCHLLDDDSLGKASYVWEGIICKCYFCHLFLSSHHDNSPYDSSTHPYSSCFNHTSCPNPETISVFSCCYCINNPMCPPNSLENIVFICLTKRHWMFPKSVCLWLEKWLDWMIYYQHPLLTMLVFSKGCY